MPRSSVKKTEEKETKKKVTTKKVATAKKASTTKKTPAKKTTTVKKAAAAKKSTATKKASTAKKVTTKKTTATKKTAAKKTATAKKTTVKKTATKKTSTKKTAISKLKEISDNLLDIIEYYDLPYRYNETVVKVLAQNPNTLFVYWDISDKDIERFKKDFGESFLENTKPVLVIHNITNNYSFEIDINDFANNWYVNVDDTKCKYSIELGRRPINDFFSNSNSYMDFIKVLSSNTIEIPNDHVLFYNDNDILQFKNIRDNSVSSRIVRLKDLQAIYKNYEFLENKNKFDFENPSSQNPSSNVI